MPLQLAPTSKPVGEGLAPPPSFASLSPIKRTIVIPSVARNLLCGSDAEVAASYGEGLVALPGVAMGSAFFCEATFPTVKYLRIFSSRFGPMPLMARKSSTLLNSPYDLRICKIFSAVTGPIPGTSCNSSEFAVLILIGAGGGFFLAVNAGAAAQRMAAARHNRVAHITYKYYQNVSYLCNNNRDRGSSHLLAPPTPPYRRVRIRRFSELSPCGPEVRFVVRHKGFAALQVSVSASPSSEPVELSRS